MSTRTGRFRRSERLLQSRDFARVARVGQRLASRNFVVLVADRGPGREPHGAPSAPVRIGITVSRKVGNAVVRNRVKRAVREWFRLCRGRLGGEADLVVIARRGAAALGAGEIAEQLCELIRNSSPRGIPA